jgi:hypothetical protein
VGNCPCKLYLIYFKNGEKYRPVNVETCEVEPRLLGSTCHPEELTVGQQEEVHTNNYRKVTMFKKCFWF